jgi:hypothetical protein
MMENWNTGSTLRETLREVERDEAEAIDALCDLLERVEESRDFRCLSPLRKVLKQWQNQPPRGIVTSLQELRERLECQDHDNT